MSSFEKGAEAIQQFLKENGLSDAQIQNLTSELVNGLTGVIGPSIDASIAGATKDKNILGAGEYEVGVNKTNDTLYNIYDEVQKQGGITVGHNEKSEASMESTDNHYNKVHEQMNNIHECGKDTYEHVEEIPPELEEIKEEEETVSDELEEVLTEQEYYGEGQINATESVEDAIASEEEAVTTQIEQILQDNQDELNAIKALDSTDIDAVQTKALNDINANVASIKDSVDGMSNAQTSSNNTDAAFKEQIDMMEAHYNQVIQELEAEIQAIKKANSSTTNGIAAHASGLKRSKTDHIAWTNEGKGQNEILYRSSDGALLTRVGTNDTVFSHAMVKNLWNIANNPNAFVAKNIALNIPEFTNRSEETIAPIINCPITINGNANENDIVNAINKMMPKINDQVQASIRKDLRKSGRK